MTGISVWIALSTLSQHPSSLLQLRSNLMLSSQRIKTLFFLKCFLRTLSPTPNLNPNLPNILSTISQKYYYSTITTDDQHSFTVSYLTNNCGFSLEAALTASKQLHFDTAQKPDSVLAFFRNHGFSYSQIHCIIRKAPHILKCDPHKTVLPKFEFLLSKGASSSNIFVLVNRNPRFLFSSLEKSIIPMYELVRRFFQSDDKKAINCMVVCPSLLSYNRAEKNVNFLLDVGVRESHICHLLRSRASILVTNSDEFKETVNEVKEMGFDPSQYTFVIALLAKGAMAKSQWDSKVEAFKSWGWSEEKVLEAFRNKPGCMLVSIDKINKVMRFWVRQLGWNSLAPVEWPGIFGYSFKKRIIPRAFVVQYLLTKGLRKKNASLYTPFAISEKLFLEKFVKCFKEESSLLLKLYQEKMDVQDNKRMV